MSESLRSGDREALDRNIRQTAAEVVIKRPESVSRDSQREELAQTRLFVAALVLIASGIVALVLFLMWGSN